MLAKSAASARRRQRVYTPPPARPIGHWQSASRRLHEGNVAADRRPLIAGRRLNKPILPNLLMKVDFPHG
jgi:hypothetical protein